MNHIISPTVVPPVSVIVLAPRVDFRAIARVEKTVEKLHADAERNLRNRGPEWFRTPEGNESLEELYFEGRRRENGSPLMNLAEDISEYRDNPFEYYHVFD